MEHGIRLAWVGRLVQVSERSDRARHQDVFPRHLASLSGELDPALDDLGQPVFEELRGELSAVGAEGVRLDQLCTGLDKAEMDADYGFGGLKVRLLRAAQPGNRRRDECAGAAVGDYDAPARKTLQRSRHRIE